MTLYESIADLPLRVEEYELSLRERDTSSGFTRTTTVIELRGDDETGSGEDVTYENEEHYALREFHQRGDHERLPLDGEYTFAEFSDLVADLDLFPAGEPERDDFRTYRRWGVESAALDLALKQSGISLADALGRSCRPVRFVVSTRLGDPPTTERLDALRSTDPNLEFKLDPVSAWTTALIERVAETNAVRVLDLKGQYHGTEVDQPADPVLYRRLVESFPDALIEDPALTEETRSVLSGHEDRVSWDYPITGVESIETLAWEPSWINVKPSRFGSVRTLLETIEYCIENEIRMYGGGQFELEVGRNHIQALASLFYPDAPNDVAPSGYNDPEPSRDLPKSPLSPPDRSCDPPGFGWRAPDRSA